MNNFSIKEKIKDLMLIIAALIFRFQLVINFRQGIAFYFFRISFWK